MTYVQKSWMRQYWIEREKQSKQKESLPLFSFVCVPSFINKNKFGTSVLSKTIYISKYHNSILWYDSVYLKLDLNIFCLLTTIPTDYEFLYCIKQMCNVS